jgi:hypothetical protein
MPAADRASAVLTARREAPVLRNGAILPPLASRV